ncbi:MAG: hypothetical protein ACTSPB_00190 [Candidatus Thorarchaeota archaeon]
MSGLRDTVRDTVKDYEGKVAIIKNNLISQVESLPDNPRIKRLDDEGLCFSISSKDLGDNWTPEYHDFKQQYKLIVEWINKSSPQRVMDILEEITTTGQIVMKKQRHKFHPDVITQLKKLL